MGMFDIFDEDNLDMDLLNEEEKDTKKKKKEDDTEDDTEKKKGKKKTDDDELTECNEGKDDDDDEDDDDDNEDDDDDDNDDDNDDEDDDEDNDEKKKGKKKKDDDDDDDGGIEDIKDEEVIDSFILNEAALEDLISLNESGDKKVNFDKERKVRWVSKEQKLKKLTYKISILMAKKNNDADYKKWAKGRAIVVAARKRIMLKYKARALARARKVISAYRAGKFTGLLQDKRDIVQPKGIQKT